MLGVKFTLVAVPPKVNDKLRNAQKWRGAPISSACRWKCAQARLHGPVSKPSAFGVSPRRTHATTMSDSHSQSLPQHAAAAATTEHAMPAAGCPQSPVQPPHGAAAGRRSLVKRHRVFASPCTAPLSSELVAMEVAKALTSADRGARRKRRRLHYTAPRPGLSRVESDSSGAGSFATAVAVDGCVHDPTAAVRRSWARPLMFRRPKPASAGGGANVETSTGTARDAPRIPSPCLGGVTSSPHIHGYVTGSRALGTAAAACMLTAVLSVRSAIPPTLLRHARLSAGDALMLASMVHGKARAALRRSAHSVRGDFAHQLCSVDLALLGVLVLRAGCRHLPLVQSAFSATSAAAVLRALEACLPLLHHVFSAHVSWHADTDTAPAPSPASLRGCCGVVDAVDVTARASPAAQEARSQVRVSPGGGGFARVPRLTTVWVVFHPWPACVASSKG